MFGKRSPRIQHPANKELYQYVLGVRFDPGAEAEGFEALFSNPLQTVHGTGRYCGALQVTQPPQQWFAQQRGISGFGGSGETGGIVGQPLLNPGEFEGP